MSQATPDGRLQAIWHQKITDTLGIRCQSQLSNDANTNSATVDLDYKKDDYNLNFKYMAGPVFVVSPERDESTGHGRPRVLRVIA